MNASAGSPIRGSPFSFGKGDRSLFCFGKGDRSLFWEKGIKTKRGTVPSLGTVPLLRAAFPKRDKSLFSGKRDSPIFSGAKKLGQSLKKKPQSLKKGT
jgi:hypothetical protein